MSDEQLQLFDTAERSARPRRAFNPTLGHAVLRHDHAVLLAIAMLIGASITFALGVERGKRLAGAESRVRFSIAADGARDAPRSTTVMSPMTPAGIDRSPAPATPPAAAPAPRKPANAPSKPSKLAAETSGFAVQVVTYSQPKVAHQELQQLQQKGEKAFLLQRAGKTSLLVGPFPTKEHATSKLSALRSRYRDCFIRTL